jgi:hypothetical protein
VPGLRSDEDILRAFEGLDKVPGSKQARRPATEQNVRRNQQILGESNGWDENPIMKVLKGEEVEFFEIGALAHALEKKVVTIRLWEKKGYIPAAPYRLRSKMLNGKKVLGNRVYTRALVEITLEEFAKRGLLGSARVEWSLLKELTDTLARRWRDSVSAG